ncbi:MAG: hypothetical protein Q9163_005360 [Psora crenata]
MDRAREAANVLETVLVQRREFYGDSHRKPRPCRPHEAERLLKGVMPIAVRTRRNEHIGTLMTKYNLARAQNGREHRGKGKDMLLELIEIQSPKLPPGPSRQACFTGWSSPALRGTWAMCSRRSGCWESC